MLVKVSVSIFLLIFCCPMAFVWSSTGTTEPDVNVIKTSVVIFMSYVYDISDLGNGKGFNRFDIERTCLNLESKISGKAKIRVTTDVYQNVKATSIKVEDGSKSDNSDIKEVKITSYYDGWSVRMKHAYFDYELVPNLVLRMGMICTPWISATDKVWNYRFVKPTFTDSIKFFSSADLGASLNIKLPREHGEIVLAVLNGPGFSKAEEDKYKDIFPVLILSPFPRDKVLKELKVGGYGYLGRRTFKDEALSRDRLGGMWCFSYDFLSVGGEVAFSKDQYLSEIGTIADVNGFGFCTFAELRLRMIPQRQFNKFGILFRIDSWDPNTKKEDDASIMILAGLTYQLTRNVRAVLDIQRTSYQSSDKDPESQILCQVETKF